eukprot:RCo027532
MDPQKAMKTQSSTLDVRLDARAHRHLEDALGDMKETLLAAVRALQTKRWLGKHPAFRVLALTQKEKEGGGGDGTFGPKRKFQLHVMKQNGEAEFSIRRSHNLKTLESVTEAEGLTTFQFDSGPALYVAYEPRLEGFVKTVLKVARDNCGACPVHHPMAVSETKPEQSLAATTSSVPVLQPAGGVDSRDLDSGSDDDLDQPDVSQLRDSTEGLHLSGSDLFVGESALILSAEEEQAMGQLLEAFHVDISDARGFAETLRREQESLERQNASAVIESQASCKDVQLLLEQAVMQLGDLEYLLKDHESRLTQMKRQIETVEAKNSELELSKKNQESLRDSVSALLSRLSLDPSHTRNLLKGEFEPREKLRLILDSLQQVEEMTSATFEGSPYLSLRAVREQLEDCARTRETFLIRFVAFLEGKLLGLKEAQLRKRGTRGARLSPTSEGGAGWEPHTVVFDTLKPFTPVMAALKK